MNFLSGEAGYNTVNVLYSIPDFFSFLRKSIQTSSTDILSLSNFLSLNEISTFFFFAIFIISLSLVETTILSKIWGKYEKSFCKNSKRRLIRNFR